VRTRYVGHDCTSQCTALSHVLMRRSNSLVRCDGAVRADDHLVGISFWDNALAAQRLRNEKPRHVVREAGLVITSDYCPATPG
jgi:hypothetical protein